MQFTWNEAKRQANKKKHKGLDFADAEQVFNGPTATDDDAAEFTPERLRRAKLRIGLKEVSREEWQAAVQKKIVKKQRINIKLDLDVLAWFKAQAAGPKYQELINAALREAMEKKRQEIA